MKANGKNNIGTIKWDKQSEIPIACNKCLGDNPYVRMMKADYDKECKLCCRPFTVFKWKINNSYKYFTTEICQLCARVKNVCQSCILDLKFGLEMDIRDKFLKQKIEIPKDMTNRDFWAYKMSKKIDNLELPYNKEENYNIEPKFIGKNELKEVIERDNFKKLKQEPVNALETIKLNKEINLRSKDNYAGYVRFYSDNDRNDNKPINIQNYLELSNKELANSKKSYNNKKPSVKKDKEMVTNQNKGLEFNIEEFDEDYRNFLSLIEKEN